MLFVTFGSPALARTVVLVYDDSGSMAAESRHQYANYATQNLVALLRPTDRFEVVRMSSPDVVIPILPSSDPQSSVARVSGWTPAGSTPYQSVRTAIERLKSLRAPNDNDSEDYWLVVFSDGEFGGFTSPAEMLNAFIGDLSDLGQHFAGRRLGVVFLGIGQEAFATAGMWGTAGATSFTARTPNEITDAMFAMASLITGRDPDSSGSSRGLEGRYGSAGGVPSGSVAVRSEFPLERLIVFYQGAARPSLRIDAASSRFVSTDGRTLPVDTRAPLSSASAGLNGVVNIVVPPPGEVFPPGTYSIALVTDRDISPSQLAYLPEVALSLQVISDSGPATRCVGAPFELRAGLVDPISQTFVPLGRLRELVVGAELEANGRREVLIFDALDDQSRTLSIGTPEGSSSLRVIARYPGYFNLRSERFLLQGIQCVEDARISTSNNIVTTEPRFQGGSESVAELALNLAAGAPLPNDARFDVTFEGIPPGWEIEVAGMRLNANSPTARNVIWPGSGDLPFRTLRSDAALPGSNTVTAIVEAVAGPVRFSQDRIVITLTIEPLIATVTPNDLGQVMLSPVSQAQPRPVLQTRITLEPTASMGVLPDTAISVEVNRLPDGLSVQLGGLPLAPNAVTTISASGSYELVILQTRDYRPQSGQSVALRFISNDPRLRLRNADVALGLDYLAPVLQITNPDLGDAAVLPSISSDYQPVSYTTVRLEPAAGSVAPTGEELVALSVSGLPIGAEIQVQGQNLRSGLDSATVRVADAAALSLALSLNNTFNTTQPFQLAFSFSSVDGLTQVNQGSAIWRLRPEQVAAGFDSGTNDVILIPRTNSSTPIEGGRFGVSITTTGDGTSPAFEKTVTLTVTGLPEGVLLEILGSRLEGRNSSMPISYTERIDFDVRVLRTAAYVRQGDATIRLTATSNDPRVSWSVNSLEKTLRPAPRTIVMTAMGEPWTTDQATLRNNTPFVLAVQSDGYVSPENEVASWRVQLSNLDRNLLMDARIDPTTARVRLEPRTRCVFGVWCVPGLTPTGTVSMTVELEASSSERTTRQVRVEISPATLWEAWGWPLTQLLLLATAIWYVIGILVKPTFKASARFCRSEEPIQRPLTWKRTELTRPLSRHMDLRSLRIIPYLPQTAFLDSYVLQATRRDGAEIRLIAIRTSNRVQINGDDLVIDKKSKRLPRLKPTNTISEQVDHTKRVVYRYITSGSCES